MQLDIFGKSPAHTSYACLTWTTVLVSCKKCWSSVQQNYIKIVCKCSERSQNEIELSTIVCNWILLQTWLILPLHCCFRMSLFMQQSIPAKHTCFIQRKRYIECFHICHQHFTSQLQNLSKKQYSETCTCYPSKVWSHVLAFADNTAHFC